jgi:hypothetical protein
VALTKPTLEFGLSFSVTRVDLTSVSTGCGKSDAFRFE